MQLLALPLFWKSFKNKKAVWLVVAIVILSFVPMVPSFAMQLFYSVERGTWVSPPLPGQYYGFLNIFLNHKVNSLIFLGLLLLVLVPFFIRSHNLKQTFKEITFRKALFVFLCFFVPYTFMFLLSFKAPMFIERYVIYTSVFFYIFLAALLCVPAFNRWLRVFFMLIFLTGMALTYNPKPDNNRDIEAAIDFIKTNKSVNTLVLVSPDYFYPTFSYHYNRTFFKDYKNTLPLLNNDNVFPVLTRADVIKVLLQHKPHNLIYFNASLAYVDPDGKILELLAQHYTCLEKRNFFEIFSVSVYQSKKLAQLAE